MAFLKCSYEAGGGNSNIKLVVTCAPAFAGSTITATDGSSTFSKVCPLTSPYVVYFENIAVGTWTVSAPYQGRTFSTVITIMDFEATLSNIPDGATVLPTDDIQTWLHCAEIFDKNYTTISQVLADSSTLQALIASNNAADYMARSTTWASSVVSDSSAMTYIGLNNYCADVLLSNATWLQAICNSTYFGSVLNVKNPTMTSDTTPSGRCFGSSLFSTNYKYWYAFDNNASKAWYPSYASGGSQAGQYCGYKFTSQTKAHYIKLKYKSRASDSVIKFQGSNDGSTYIDLREITVSNTGGTDSYFDGSWTITNDNAYEYYRVYIVSGTGGTSGQGFGLNQMDIYTRVENLEKLVDELVKHINRSKKYTDFDIAGVRQNMSEFEKTVFPEWIPKGHDYLVSERVSYNGELYRCIQGHKSQADWAPDVAVSLWVLIDDPAIEWPEWKQPTGAHDAYQKGDKVSHNDKHWTSDIDANVYEPGVYGWTEA